MKKNIKFYMAAALLGLTASCTDLDVDIDSQYTQYPNNEIALSAKLAGCYNYMRNEGGLSRNYWEGVMLQGDEMMAVCYNNGYFDNGRAVLPSLHMLNPDIPGIGQMDALMSGITYCNTVILEIGGADGKDAVVAPVRAARAFYEFLMLDFYGDCPLLDHSPAEGEVIERAPRAKVAEFVESELLEIMDQLTEENNANTYGTPNKWMAKALLAKLYLNWPVYTKDVTSSSWTYGENPKLQDCVSICDDIINSGIFEVGKGYFKKFQPDNGVHIKDFIYAAEYDPATLGDNYDGGNELDRFLIFKKANSCTDSEGNANGPWGFKPGKSCAGTWIVTPEAAARFTLAGDERNQMILKGPQYIRDYANGYELTTKPLYFNGAQVNYTPIEDYADWQNKGNLDVGADNVDAHMMAGYRLYKYPSEPATYSTFSRKGSNDVPIFRYADVLLTKAECILRGASANTTAAALVNEVRDCSGAEHCTTIDLPGLLDERSREMFCEMWRRQDLIRYGQFENDWGFKNEINPDGKNPQRRLFPIPTGVMDTNTNWKQNASY